MCLNGDVVLDSTGKFYFLISSEHVEIDNNHCEFLLDSDAKLEAVSFNAAGLPNQQEDA